MKKFLLFISLIAVADGWGSRSILIAQTSTDAASAAPSASAAAENKPELLKTSPNGMFRVIQDGEEFWIVTAADEKQRTKMHSAELVTPEEFRFSPNEKWLYVELHHGSYMSGADLYRRTDSQGAGSNAVGPF